MESPEHQAPANKGSAAVLAATKEKEAKEAALLAKLRNGSQATQVEAIPTPEDTPATYDRLVPEESTPLWQEPFRRQHTPVPQPNTNSFIVEVPNDKIPVTFEFEVAENKTITVPQTPFTVRLNAYSVNVNDSCISLFHDDTVVITPPIMTPFKLKVGDNQDYTVLYLGGTHNLGKLTNLSFILTT